MKTKLNIKEDPKLFQEILDNLAKCKITEYIGHGNWKDILSHNQGGVNTVDITDVSYHGKSQFGEEIWHLEYDALSEEGFPHINVLHVLAPKQITIMIK